MQRATSTGSLVFSQVPPVCVCPMTSTRTDIYHTVSATHAKFVAVCSSEDLVPHNTVSQSISPQHESSPPEYLKSRIGWWSWIKSQILQFPRGNINQTQSFSLRIFTPRPKGCADSETKSKMKFLVYIYICDGG
jgi:hypothetical protein